MRNGCTGSPTAPALAVTGTEVLVPVRGACRVVCVGLFFGQRERSWMDTDPTRPERSLLRAHWVLVQSAMQRPVVVTVGCWYHQMKVGGWLKPLFCTATTVSAACRLEPHFSSCLTTKHRCVLCLLKLCMPFVREDLSAHQNGIDGSCRNVRRRERGGECGSTSTHKSGAVHECVPFG